MSYDCSGTILCLSASPVSQFDLSCTLDGMWGDDVLRTSEFSRRDVADADLITPTRSNCSLCVAPDHPGVVSVPHPYDTITHCVGMSAHGAASYLS